MNYRSFLFSVVLSLLSLVSCRHADSKSAPFAIEGTVDLALKEQKGLANRLIKLLEQPHSTFLQDLPERDQELYKTLKPKVKKTLFSYGRTKKLWLLSHDRKLQVYRLSHSTIEMGMIFFFSLECKKDEGWTFGKPRLSYQTIH